MPIHMMGYDGIDRHKICYASKVSDMSSDEAFDELWNSLVDVEEYLRSGISKQLHKVDSFSGDDMKPVHEAFLTYRRLFPHLAPEIRDAAEDLFNQLETGLNKFLDSLRQYVEIPEANAQDRESAESDALQILNDVLQQHRHALNDLAQKRSSTIKVGNPHNGSDTYDAFISHASEDKDELVRPLVAELRKRDCEIWYDEFELEVGDSLRESINDGISCSRFGVVVLSNNYFDKQWPEAELNGLVTKQRSTSQRVILPIWHGVSKGDIIQHSPTLADTFALSSDRSDIGEIANHIENVIT
jgi:hypothetical protein